jgi:hypothetical protein
MYDAQYLRFRCPIVLDLRSMPLWRKKAMATDRENGKSSIRINTYLITIGNSGIGSLSGTGCFTCFGDG